MGTAFDREAPASGKTDPGRRGSHAVRWWVLAVLSTAQLMVTLDATVVNIALPAAQQDLGFSDGSRQWVITGYALAFGSLLLLGGAAGSFEMLVTARVAQRLFAAPLAPAALSLLSVTFTEPAERARAFGVFSAPAGAGGAAGLLLGGMLTAWASWRWVMYVNVVFAAVALAGALLWLAKPAITERPRIDVPGTLVVSTALFAVIYGFAHVESTSWTDPVALGSMITGVVLLAVFVWLESRVAHPLLPLRLVRDRTRGGSFLAVFVVGMGMFSIFLFLTYYLEAGLGYSPIRTGLAFLPMVGGIVAAATTAPALLLPRVGPKAVVSAGFLVAATGMALPSRLELDSTYAAHIMPGMILLGLGLGRVMTTAFQGATAGVHHEDTGVASALINTGQQVGGSISTALLTTVASSAASDYLSSHKPGAQAAAQARVEGYTATLAWGAGFFVVGAVLAAILIPNTAPAPSEGEPVIAHRVRIPGWRLRQSP
ncbi:MFS transporter [Streptomyces acidiscabies]|uniref:MFS transporter n=1 Tax=Streptomyces acidiscabies TaxID=42234 RepID=UPI0038F638E5